MSQACSQEPYSKDQKLKLKPGQSMTLARSEDDQKPLFPIFKKSTKIKDDILPSKKIQEKAASQPARKIGKNAH